MRHLITSFLLLTASAICAKTPIYKDASAPIETRVADLLSRMTTEEKAGQLTCLMGWEMYERRHDGSVGISPVFRQQNSGAMPVGAYWAVLRADPWTQKTLTTGLKPHESAEALNAMQAYAVDSTRLGIPILFAEEAPHGHMAIGTTVIPTGLGMASTWNIGLINEAGRMVGRELALQGASIGYGPVLDIARDPRWSRMEETLGEDPYLTGEIGIAYMLGMQDTTLVHARRVYSTLKHFAAYGIPGAGLNGVEAQVGPIRLFSELLPPFEKAVKAGAGSIMTSYNSIDGIPSTGNRFLLTDILRDKWGFEGIVFSDLFSIDGMAGVTARDRMSAGTQALTAGVDIDLGGSAYGQKLCEAIKRGLVSIDEVDKAVAHVLRIKFLAGLFENPYVDPNAAAADVGTAKAREIAREVARQSITLLKNDGVLPLSRDISSIAVIGPNADTQYNQLGDYTAPQDSD
ncbi:MAG: glycoside hydrolase family 3 C-terminal domain-containing protein, partial [Muribaculaceae bacterium]|nr:glycoside hydrolase family 3 C-terminal domain-containing protein [Muribaculaceae bacterium]